MRTFLSDQILEVLKDNGGLMTSKDIWKKLPDATTSMYSQRSIVMSLNCCLMPRGFVRNFSGGVRGKASLWSAVK